MQLCAIRDIRSVDPMSGQSDLRSEPIADESVRYTKVCVERWSSFDDMAPACVAKDAEVLHECYETGFELFIS